MHSVTRFLWHVLLEIADVKTMYNALNSFEMEVICIETEKVLSCLRRRYFKGIVHPKMKITECCSGLEFRDGIAGVAHNLLIPTISVLVTLEISAHISLWRTLDNRWLEQLHHLHLVFSSGGPLSALTCCVNVRLLSAIKKISPLIYSQSWVGNWVYTTQAIRWLSPWYFSADVYLAELHCRGREQVFELEARSPWWTDC